MNALRVGISGCTPAAIAAAQATLVHDHCRVVAAHDDDPAALAAFRAATGVGTVTGDFAALLATGIDFVVLMHGAGDRLARVQAAVEQAVPVLLEAPLAFDADTAGRLLAACDAVQMKCGVMVPGHGDPLLEQLRRMIAADWLGGIVAVQTVAGEPLALHTGSRPLPSPFVQHAANQLQLVRWLSGRAVLRVTAQTLRAVAPELPDTGVATAVLRGNLAATFTASHAFAANTLAVHGLDGGFRLAGDRLWLCGRNAFRGPVFDYPSAGAELVLTRAELRPALAALQPEHELLGRFARWLEDSDDFPCPGEQALDDLRAAVAMDRAAVSGRTETI